MTEEQELHNKLDTVLAQAPSYLCDHIRDGLRIIAGSMKRDGCSHPEIVLDSQDRARCAECFCVLKAGTYVGKGGLKIVWHQ